MKSQKKCFADMQRVFEDKNCEIPNKIFYANFDPYPVSSDHIQKLEDINPLLLTRDIKFWLKKEEMEDLHHEKFSVYVNDNWANYIEKSKDKIISFLGTINESEFCFSPLSARPYDISVPGVGYYNRKVSHSSLKGTDLKMPVEGSGLRRIIRSKIALIAGSRNSLNAYQASFRQSIEDSKTCFTCGSALGYPIRKFFEIPAMGSLLLCKPFAGFVELGFQDKVNCISVEPQATAENCIEILDNIDSAQKIASAGQSMILDRHSFSARLIQLEKMIEKLMLGDFKGSVWEKGSMKIL